MTRQVHLARQDDDVVAALRRGEPGATAVAVDYLEADRWGYRTGYVKQSLLRHLRQGRLTAEQVARLQPVLLRYVEVGWRWEFAEACRLARRCSSSELRLALLDQLHGDDLEAAVRAVRMLTTMRHPHVSDADRDLARRTLVRWADERNIDGAARWLPAVVRRLWTPAWRAELAQAAAASTRGDAEDRYRGIAQLLKAAPKVQT